jgi:benzodiazapine receptor
MLKPILPGFEKMNEIKYSQLPKLALSILVCQLAGVVGSVFTSSSVSDWYPTLIKPSFTPPGWVIGFVWIILFTLMGISLFLVWQKGPEKPEVRLALIVFFAQLAVNVFWNVAFFGLRSPPAGMAVIIVLLALIAVTIYKFLPISRTAALLLIPYILWVSFAAFLNFTLWRLNS